MRLLLADHETALSKSLITLLKKNNFAADAVYDGETALDYLEIGSYDGVILDLMTPKMEGISVLKKIRAQGNLIPVLILTAKAEVDTKVLGLDSGANDYVTKPFSTDELLARLRAMLRTQGSQTTALLRLGNITLNQATFELSSPTGSFHLANKEFQMLELFMSNPRQLISTERIVERIWGYESDTGTNVVWVYISYLRKKLSALKATIHLRATRNVGYTLEEVE